MPYIMMKSFLLKWYQLGSLSYYVKTKNLRHIIMVSVFYTCVQNKLAGCTLSVTTCYTLKSFKVMLIKLLQARSQIFFHFGKFSQKSLKNSQNGEKLHDFERNFGQGVGGRLNPATPPPPPPWLRA
ncbi:unnamed protein product [Owenia fusiformis]|uniref:Uncharacterized protein n=1 Tax=Owenia fusiformis TaxID=6347 RepID=A0A8S4PV52_OWEFU|nr:unnamed protein product [Owenia fusiformis]